MVKLWEIWGLHMYSPALCKGLTPSVHAHSQEALTHTHLCLFSTLHMNNAQVAHVR